MDGKKEDGTAEGGSDGRPQEKGDRRRDVGQGGMRAGRAIEDASFLLTYLAPTQMHYVTSKQDSDPG